MDGDKTREELLEEIDLLRARIEELQQSKEELHDAAAACGELLETASEMFAYLPCGLMVYQYQPPNELFLINSNKEAERLTELTFGEMRGQEFDEMWPNARGSGLTGALLRTMETGESFETDRAIFRSGTLERRFKLKAFRMPADRLGLALETPGDESLEEERVTASAGGEPAARSTTGSGGAAEATHEMLLRVEPLSLLGEVAAGAVFELDDLIQRVLENSWTGSSCVESGHYEAIGPYVSEIRDSALEAAKIIELVHQLARLDGEEAGSEDFVFDLNDGVLAGVQLSELWWERHPRNKGTEISVQMELTQGCKIRGDQGAVVELVVSLIKNAIEAYPDGGVIKVKTAVSVRGQAILQIRDRGVGTAEESISTVFQPFWSNKGGAHRGLGLARAEMIVQSFGGEIYFDSEQGKGTSVTVRFPLAAQATSEPIGETTRSLELKLSILLVVNTKSIVKMLDSGLSKHGQTVVTARSATEALQAFKTNHIDLVICDMSIPGDALNLSREIKKVCKQNRRPKALFILLTGWGQEFGDTSEVERAGVDKVFPKPVEVQKLVEAIRDLLVGA